MARWNSQLAFHLTVRLLKILGVVPRDSWPSWVNVTIISGSVFAFLFLVGPSIYGLTYRFDETDPQQRIGVITTQGEILFGLLKMTVLISKRSQVSRLLQRHRDLWRVIENDDDKLIEIQRYLKQGSSVIFGYAANAVFITIVNMTAAIFGQPVYDENGIMIKSKELPLSAAIIHRNQTVYYIWYMLQIPTGLIAGCVIVSIDIFSIFLILHATAHMKIIETRLKEIGERPMAEGFAENLTTRREFVECIHHHQNVLIYCQELEDIFRYVMLLQIVLRMGSGIIGFDVIKGNSDGIKSIAHLTAVIGVLLLHCWFPEQLRTESSAISQIVYSMPWVSVSPSQRRILHIMMMRADKPVSLTAGNFTIMSLSTFSEVISKALSFFALLRATL